MPDLQFFTEMMVLGILAWVVLACLWRWVFGGQAGDGPYSFLARHLLPPGEDRSRQAFFLGGIWLALIYVTGALVEPLSQALVESRLLMTVVTAPSQALVHYLPGLRGDEVPDLGFETDHLRLVSMVYADACGGARAADQALDASRAPVPDWLCGPVNGNFAGSWWASGPAPGWAVEPTDAMKRHLLWTHGAAFHRLDPVRVAGSSVDRVRTHFRLARGSLFLAAAGFLVSAAAGAFRLATAGGAGAGDRHRLKEIATVSAFFCLLAQVAWIALARAEVSYHLYLLSALEVGSWVQ